MITITLQFETTGQALRALTRIKDSAEENATGQLMASLAAEKVKVADAPKPVATQAAPVTATPTPAATAPATPAAASPSETPAPDYTAVKSLVLEVVKAKGSSAAAALLAEFGAKKGPDLKEDQYAAVAKRAQEILA